MGFDTSVSGIKASSTNLEIIGSNIANAGTTGYNLTMDARYTWMHQKRMQGSHFATLKQASAANDLVCEGRLNPCLSEVFDWNTLPDAHTLMRKNEHAPGNMAVMINALERGQKTIK